MVSQYIRDISNSRVSAHVDWPLFESMKVSSIFCMSAAILMYSPAPKRAAIECVNPLFEQNELFYMNLCVMMGIICP